MSRAASATPEMDDDPPSLAHPFDRLPFVTPYGGQTETNIGERCFWAPRPTGDYFMDCSLGEQYGEAFLAMVMAGEPDLLRYVVLAIVEHGDPVRDRGVLVGMWGVIGHALAHRQPPALRLVKGAVA